MQFDLEEKTKDFLYRCLNGYFFYWFPVLMGIGIFIYFALDNEPSFSINVFVCFTFAALSYFFFGLKRYLFFGLCLCLTFILLGMCLAQLRTQTLNTYFIEKEGIYKIQGNVVLIEPFDKAKRVVLDNVKVEEKDIKNVSKIRLSSYHADNLKIGDTVSVLTKLRPPSGPVVTKGFDFRKYAYFRQWSGVGFTLSEFEILKQSNVKSFQDNFSILRNIISEKLNRIENPEQRAVMNALLTGNRKAIPEELLEDIRDAGLAHLLSISGLHVGLVSGFIFFLIRFSLAMFPMIVLRFPIKKIAALFAMFSAVFYMLLVGAPIPTQRAVIMSTIVFLAVIFDRSPISFRLAALAALITMVIRPESVTEVSFQLSFAAVLSLVAFYSWAYKALPKDFYSQNFIKRFTTYFIGVVMTTIVASLATAPLTLYHFQHFAALGIISNMVAVPLVSFVIMPLGVVSLILMPMGMEGVPLDIAAQAIAYVVDVSVYTANLDYAVLRSPQIPSSSMMLFMLGSFFLLLTHPPMRYISILFFCLSVIPLTHIQKPDILVSQDASLFGVLKKEGLNLNTIRSEKYTAEQWAENFGFHPDQIFQLDKCDEKGCSATLDNHIIHYLYSYDGLKEACDVADIIVIKQYLWKKDACKAETIFALQDLSKNGAQSIFIKSNVSKSALNKNKDRPWLQN